MGNSTNRAYKRGAPHRDARLFIIVSEGEREDSYFRFFMRKSQRLKIAIVPRDGGSSSPKFFIERLSKYLTKEYDSQLIGQGDDPASDSYDQLWFVLDVDRWPRHQLEELQSHCTEGSKWNLAISNPCFEVWLHNHFNEIPPALDNAGQLKHAVSLLDPGGYNIGLFAPRIEEAANRSKNTDPNPEHFYPEIRVTKVYYLATQLLPFLGRNWSNT